MLKPLENIWIKIIALIMGLLLWIHVATEKVYNHEITLPITNIILKDKLTLSSQPPESLIVVVSAIGKQLLRSKWRERGVQINASNLSEGRYELELTNDNTFLVDAENVTLDKIILPGSINMFIDQLSEKKVKVKTLLIPLPDEGYAIRKISIPQPSEVTLTGARSILRSLNFIATEEKTITGLRTDLTVTVPLSVPEDFGITVSPDSVTLALEVVPVKTRIFDKIPIVIYNNPVNISVTTKPSFIRIELTGPPEEIDQLDPGTLIASIDYNKIDSYGFTEISIDCPSIFIIKKTSANTARIVVE